MDRTVRIFIVEDEPRIARFLQIELDHEGFETAIEGNGTRAFERIMQEPYDLVLLDVMLPGMDGMTICKRVREITDIPIIMLTAKDWKIRSLVWIWAQMIISRSRLPWKNSWHASAMHCVNALRCNAKRLSRNACGSRIW